MTTRFSIFRRCLFLCGWVLSLDSFSGDSTLNASAADGAWKTLQHDFQTPPPPLKQLPDRMFSHAEIQDYYMHLANRAGEVADEAKEFYLTHPKDAHAVDAQSIYFELLHTAVGFGGTNKIAELESVTASRMQSPGMSESNRFQLSLRLLHSSVSGRQYESDDAMRLELERRARQLSAQYPGHPEGDQYLLGLARTAATEKSVALASEILARDQDPKVQSECQGLINRAAAVGHALPLKLTLTDGTTLDLQQWRGKVVMLLLWDTASHFSSKAIWAVNQLYLKHHAEGLEVIGLNFDADRGQAMASLKDANVVWPQYLDASGGGKIQSQFGIKALPLCWLVDKEGVLRELKAERNPEVLVNNLLAENAPVAAEAGLGKRPE